MGRTASAKSSSEDSSTCAFGKRACVDAHHDVTSAALLAGALRHVGDMAPTGAVRALWGAVELGAGSPAQLEPLAKAVRRGMDLGALDRDDRGMATAAFGKLAQRGKG